MTTTLDTPSIDTPASARISAPRRRHPAAPTTPSASPGRIRAAWRSERIKLATTRAPRVITALTVLVGGMASFMVAQFVTDQEITVANIFGFSAVFTAVFAAVSGILIYTSEAEHRTTQHTFAAEPRRAVVVAGKTAVTVAHTALLGLAGLAAGAGGAAIGGAGVGDASAIPTTIAWATGFAVLAGVLGLGIGLIARHSAAAISGILVWWLVIESLVGVFTPERVARFMPFVAGNGMLQFVDDGERIAFDRPITALIFAGYAFAALAVGTAVTTRIDP